MFVCPFNCAKYNPILGSLALALAILQTSSGRYVGSGLFAIAVIVYVGFQAAQEVGVQTSAHQLPFAFGQQEIGNKDLLVEYHELVRGHETEGYQFQQVSGWRVLFSWPNRIVKDSHRSTPHHHCCRQPHMAEVDPLLG